MGSLSIVFFAYFAKVVLFRILFKPFYEITRCGKTLVVPLYISLFFSEIILICIEGYIELLIAGIFSFIVPDSNQDNNSLMKRIGNFYLVVTLIILPIFMIWVLYIPFKIIRSKRFYRKFYPIIDNLKLETKM